MEHYRKVFRWIVDQCDVLVAYYYCTSILIHDTLIKTHIRLELYVFLIIQSFLQMWFRLVYKELHADRETGC